MQDSVAQFEHVYWLGGGSGAGKSTMARRLAQRHGMTLYSSDEAMKSHSARCDPEERPQLEAFKRMSMDQRWLLRSPEVMLDTFHWYSGEGFRSILEDIQALPREQPIIVEGFRLPPHLVKPALAKARHGIWLLPTPEFRLQAFTTRGSLWDIPN